MFLSFWYFGWFSGVLGLINDTLKMANNIIEIIIIIFTLLTRYDAKKTEKSAQIDGQGKFLWRDLAERKKNKFCSRAVCQSAWDMWRVSPMKSPPTEAIRPHFPTNVCLSGLSIYSPNIFILIFKFWASIQILSFYISNSEHQNTTWFDSCNTTCLNSVIKFNNYNENH